MSFETPLRARRAETAPSGRASRDMERLLWAESGPSVWVTRPCVHQYGAMSRIA
jgi:hypothetical protein